MVPRRFHGQLLIAGLGMAIMLALLGSMGAVDGAPGAPGKHAEVVPAEGGAYAEAIVGHPKYLNPLLSHFNDVDDDLASLLFEGLTRLTPEGELAPALATDWTVSDDGLRYTFNLRRDVTWHDGTKFTADDVVFTIQSIQAKQYAGSPSIRDLWQDVAVRKLDDHRVQFELKAPFAPFLEYTTQGVVPKHILGNVPPGALPEHSFNARPVGTGSFRLVSASVREVVLQPNEAYYGPRPYLRRLAFRFYSSTDQALAALQRGDVEGVRYVPPDRIDRLPAPRIEVRSRPELSKLTLLLLNTQDPLLGDIVVRQAIQVAIDRKQLMETVHRGQGEAAFGPIVPASWAFNPAVRDGASRPDRAKALLDQAGWRDADGDGIRERDGKKLQFVLLTNDRPERVAAAQEVSRQLRAVGVAADVQAAGWTGVVQDFLVPRRFQAVLIEQWSPTVDPDVYQFWHSSQIKSGLNFSGWSHRGADELLEQARRERNREARAKLYQDFQAIFAREAPAVPLYYPSFTYAVSRQVRGVKLGLMLRPSDRFAAVTEWRVLTQRAPRKI